MSIERVRRWNGALGAAVLLAAIGIATGRPALSIGGSLPLLFVIGGALSGEPDTPQLAVERSVSTSAPFPGEAVEVTVSVENEGQTPVSDLRVVDGVPSELSVTAGTPRASLALSPGDSQTFTYTLTARRGEHDFTAVLCRLWSLWGTRRRTTLLTATGTVDLICESTPTESPTTSATTQQRGTLTASTAGDGMEFHSTREYQPGDSVRDIDWRRFAKTGSLVTVRYREERSTRVHLLVDLRETTAVASSPGSPRGDELSAYVAGQLSAVLYDAGNQVGAATLGVDKNNIRQPLSAGNETCAWIDPSQAALTTQRIAQLLDDAGEVDAVRRSNRIATQGIRERLSDSTHVIAVTPLTDTTVVESLEELRRGGVSITVVTPLVFDGESMGQRVGSVEHAQRCSALRDVGIEVHTWQSDEPLHSSLETLIRRSPQ
ncbi:DUF58 domain-containing protein [Haloferax profundi]|uniref:DUF58 domain-containing protein n=1 Tax=Haloferax profundi TaxID=1544718 RepID=UPI0009EAF6FC